MPLPRVRVQGWAVVLLIVSIAAPPAAAASEKLAVMPLSGKRVAKETTEVLDEILLSAMGRRGSYDVMGASDINALLGLERMKDALACDDVACATELGGALGVRLLLAGSVSRLGDEIIVTLKLIDTRSATVTKRGEAHVADNENLLRQAVENAVASLVGESPQVVGGGGGTESVQLSGPMYQRFLAVGLERANYLDFATSSLEYPVWAAHYNDTTESLVLEISKWVCSGTAVLILGTSMGFQGASDGVGTSIAVSMPMLLSSAALWIIDLVNIGNAPERLPGQDL